MIYAVPGVPSEMREMVADTVVPDLVRRSGRQATIRSRFLRVWGMTESKVAEVVAPASMALEAPGSDTTIAFLASATRGFGYGSRPGPAATDAPRGVAGTRTKRKPSSGRCSASSSGAWTTRASRWSSAACWPRSALRLAVAESLTGGLVAARLTYGPGGQHLVRRGVVSYGEDVKRSLLGVAPGRVVERGGGGGNGLEA